LNKLAIFDCDGTLVDSQSTICRAMEECFVGAKLEPPSREATRRVVGLSLIEAVQAILPDADAEFHAMLADKYKAAFFRMRQNGEVEEPLFEGTIELLAALEEQEWLLGIATGKSDRGLHHCLETHGIRARFVTLQTADRHPSKPHPSMVEAAIADAGASAERCIMVGDTQYDIAMAKAANVRAVGVAWGYHPADELIEAGADHIASRPADVLSYAGLFA
jgi:phosphoglycolate phosphatase